MLIYNIIAYVYPFK